MNRTEALHILGLDDGATADDIKIAYRETVQILHPDKFAGNVNDDWCGERQGATRERFFFERGFEHQASHDNAEERRLGYFQDCLGKGNSQVRFWGHPRSIGQKMKKAEY